MAETHKHRLLRAINSLATLAEAECYRRSDVAVTDEMDENVEGLFRAVKKYKKILRNFVNTHAVDSKTYQPNDTECD